MSLTQAKPCSIPTVNLTLGADSPPWYAAYTLPRHEKAVAEHLAFRQVETYLPLYLSARQWKHFPFSASTIPLEVVLEGTK